MTDIEYMQAAIKLARKGCRCKHISLPVCLAVTFFSQSSFTADVMQEVL